MSTKIFMGLFVFILFPMKILAQDSIQSIKKDIDESFSHDSFIAKAFKKNLDDQIELNKSFDDTDRYIKNRIQYGKSRYCLLFQLNEEDRKKFKVILNKINSLSEFKNFDSKDMSILLNRDIRHKITAVTEIPRNERYKFCEEALPKEVIEKNIARIKAAEESESSNLDKFDMFHPILKKAIVGLRDDLKKSDPKMPNSKLEEIALRGFFTHILPILNTNAELQVLPEVEKKCPGKVDEVFKLCNGNEFYDMNAPFQKMSSGLMKHLCLSDNKNLVVPKCIDEKELLR